MDFNKELFIETIKRNIQIDLTDEAIEKLIKIAEMLVSENEKYNLTSITETEKMAVLHFADSISLFSLESVKIARSIIDIGCGGGFPSLVIAAVDSSKKVCAMDATSKKVTFVANCAKENGLNNVKAICARAEEAAYEKAHRAKYDVAVSRGVARLNKLVELCLPFVKVGGCFIAMKGSMADEEAVEAENAIFQLGGVIDSITRISFADDEYDHHLVCIKKVVEPIEKYPRKYSAIKNNPL